MAADEHENKNSVRRASVALAHTAFVLIENNTNRRPMREEKNRKRKTEHV